MTEEYYVEPCEFTCAKKFLDALDETNEMWRGDTWLYRGQNVDYPLLPTAMRPCKIIDDIVTSYYSRMLENATSNACLAQMIEEDFEELYRPFRDSTRHIRLVEETLRLNENKISMAKAELIVELRFRDTFHRNYVSNILHKAAERLVVAAFIELADQTGLIVPRDNVAILWDKPFPLHDQIVEFLALGSSHQRNVTQDITDEYASIAFALARHHEVPTRLIDFTYRPLVAAFFSANGEEVTEDESDRYIVVWAIHQKSLRRTDLQVVKHRRSEIGFMQAQDGAFIYDTKADEKYWFAGVWSPLEHVIHELAEKGYAFKFTLPYSKRRDLLDKLMLKGISKPTLMPSFDNVAQEIRGGHFDLIRFVENKA